MSHSSILIDQSGPISISLVALSAHAAAAFAILYQNKKPQTKKEKRNFSSFRIETTDITENRKRQHNKNLLDLSKGSLETIRDLLDRWIELIPIPF